MNIINEIILSPSAYFYKIKDGVDIASLWESTCDAIKDKIALPAEDFIETDWKEIQENNEVIRYRICVFRLNEEIPSFATDIQDFQWRERKIGYLVMVVYNGCIAIQKRNATFSKKDLIPIDYAVLTSINSGAKYNKISMKNLDGSANVIRSKTLTANNLQESMPYIGASRYAINTIVGKQNSNKAFTISLSTSRIGEYSEDISADNFAKWAKKHIDSIIANPNQSTDFLAVFARSINYNSQYGQLKPVSILLFRQKIVDILADPNCVVKRPRRNNRIINKDALIKYIDLLSDKPITLNEVQNSNTMYVSDLGEIKIHKLQYYLLFRSGIFDNLQLSGTPNGIYNFSLGSLIRQEHLYNVYFDKISLVYTNGALFEDHRLLDSAERLLDVLDDGIAALATADSEKGTNNSIFSAVENQFAQGDNYLICGDLGTEWGDHILINEGEIKVMFFAEKHKGSSNSASAFQEVIGQALKNLGYFTPTEKDLAQQQSSWERPYNWGGNMIHRLRHHPNNKTLQDAIDVWKKNMTHPLFKKEMCIVVNFISKGTFKTDLHKAITNAHMNAKVKATTFQRIWILSSFVNTCLEVGVTPKIYCKP